jgi:hypothetical protein
MLNDLQLISLAAQILCQPRRTWCAQGNVKPSATKVTVDDQSAPIRLSHDRL